MREALLKTIGLLLCCGVISLGVINTGFISTAAAKAPVWKVSKGSDHIFLGGTIHVLSANDYPLPGAFESAFEQSHEVIFEIDLDEMNDPQLMQSVSANLMFQDDQTLQGSLNEGTYSKLKIFLQQRGLSIDSFQKLKPVGVSLSLVVLEMQNLGMSSSDGVDQFFYQRAEKSKKEISALETVQEQMSFIAQMGEVNADVLIESTLRDVNNLDEGWQLMRTAWLSGDTENLHKLLVEPMQKEFPSIYRLMLLDRNNNWMKKIMLMFADKEIELVLVGALHMVGKDGLLEQLRKRGYTVQQLD